ncbi:unnamed protein product, partial [Pocillopora meandrina]
LQRISVKSKVGIIEEDILVVCSNSCEGSPKNGIISNGYSLVPWKEKICV